MVADLFCPSCEITIQNPQLTNAGRVRCQNCGFSFKPGAAFSAAPMPAVSTSAAIPERDEAPELGAPLQGASYGMLKIVVWVLLAVFLVGGVLNIVDIRQQTAQLQAVGTPGNPQRAAKLQSALWAQHGKLAAIVVHMIRDAAIAFALLAMVRVITKLDDNASWLSWRSGGLARFPDETRGSNLHFIGPLSVSGGLIVIGALLFGAKGDALLEDLDYSPWVVASLLVLFGVLLFFTGLACADLNHFFQRMSVLARGLRLRQRGPDVNLGDPLRPSQPIPTHSPVYLLFGTAAVLCVWLLFFFTEVGDFATSRGVERAPGLVLLLLGFLILVGGAYSFYRLALGWRSMLEAWEWAAASVPAAHKEARRTAQRRHNLRGFTLASYILVGAQIILTLFLCVIIPKNEPLSYKLLLLVVLAASALFLLWLAALREDGHRLRLALEICSNRETPDPDASRAGRPWTGLLYGFTALYTLLMLAIGGISTYTLFQVAALTAQGKEDYMYAVGMALFWSIFLGLIIAPAFCLALSLRDAVASNASLTALRARIDGA